MADAIRATVFDPVETAWMEARGGAPVCADSVCLATRTVHVREIGLRAAVARQALIDRIEEMHATLALVARASTPSRAGPKGSVKVHCDS